MSKFFKWFTIILIGFPTLAFLIGCLSIKSTKSFDIDASGNVQAETHFIDIRLFNAYQSNYYDMFSQTVSVTNWQSNYFIPGVHNISLEIADAFFPNFDELNKNIEPFFFVSFGYAMIYNLLPCVIIITCFGTISWCFKLWN